MVDELLFNSHGIPSTVYYSNNGLITERAFSLYRLEDDLSIEKSLWLRHGHHRLTKSDHYDAIISEVCYGEYPNSRSAESATAYSIDVYPRGQAIGRVAIKSVFDQRIQEITAISEYYYEQLFDELSAVHALQNSTKPAQ